jgi:hypothetical protein
MGETKQTPVTIDDKEYILEEMSEQAQTMVNHIRDLDRKISSTKFNLDQLNVGREAFFSMLKGTLESEASNEETA